MDLREGPIPINLITIKQSPRPKENCSRVEVRTSGEEITTRRPPAATPKASTHNR